MSSEQPSTARILDAGGLLVHGDSPNPDSNVEPVTARTYRHGMLPDRPVVRLATTSLGPADDLAMEFLGFGVDGTPREVARGRARALGFPAWAIINDPANARHALALVKDLRRIARMAKSRPGAAADEAIEMAARLEVAVPHFLPTFYEEVARTFLDADNLRYAGSMFAKARDVERSHGLVIDEERVHQVFLEFCFAGAVPARAFTEHGKDLAARRVPGEAYSAFRRLAFERTAGGLAPYSQLLTELSRLAKAAKLDPKAEAAGFLDDVLELPTLVRAPAGFWKAASPALVSLCRDNVDNQRRLLRAIPETDSVAAVDVWLDVLMLCGADRLVVEEPGGAEWLTAVHRLRKSGWSEQLHPSPVLLGLVQRMAPGLREAAEPVLLDKAQAWRAEIDIDLLDLLLTENVPVVVSGSLQANVSHLVSCENHQYRDLTAIAESPDFRPGLVAEVGAFLAGLGGRAAPDSDDMGAQRRRVTGHSEAPNRRAPAESATKLAQNPGLRSALSGYLDDCADSASTSLTDLRAVLAVLTPLPVDLLAEVNPAAVKRLTGIDVTEVVAESLRAGLLDELGWADFDDVANDLLSTVDCKENHGHLTMSAAWPYLAVVRELELRIIGLHGVLKSETLPIPAAMAPGARYNSGGHHMHVTAFGGDYLLQWSDDNWNGHALWSTAPGAVFDTTRIGFGQDGSSVLLPDGRRFLGNRTVAVGDDHWGETRPVYSDGHTLWVSHWDRSQWQWREIDPETGNLGRVSLPSFVDDTIGEGALTKLSLQPAGPEFADSPLGWKDGSVGWAAIREQSGLHRGVGVDGRALADADSGSNERTSIGIHRTSVRALVDWPGRTPLAISDMSRGDGLALWDPTNGRTLAYFDVRQEFGPYSAGTPAIAPLDFWHYLRPRDPAGSAALRAITTNVTAELLTLAAAGDSDAVAEILPDVTSPALQRGIAGIAAIGAYVARVHRLFVERANTAGDSTPLATPSDGAIGKVVEGLWNQRTYWGSETWHWHEQLTSLLRLAESAEADGAPPDSDFVAGELNTLFRHDDNAGWLWAARAPEIAVWRAVAPGSAAVNREAATLLLRHVASAGFTGEKAHWRWIGYSQRSNQEPPKLHRGDGFVAVVVNVRDWVGGPVSAEAVQYSRSGEFTDLPDWPIEQTGEFSARDLTALADLVESRPALTWDSTWVDRFVAATGASRAQATLMLAGGEGLRSYEKAFLPTDVRKTLGLSVAEAAAARDALRQMPAGTLAQLLAAFVPADAERLWVDGPDIEAAAQVWNTHFGRRAQVDPDVEAAAAAVLTAADTTATLGAIADPANVPWLNTPPMMSIVDGAASLGARHGTDTLSSRRIMNTIAVAGWLSYHLPVGHELRARLPIALEALAATVNSPEMILDLGTEYDDASLVAALGIGSDEVGVIEKGALIVVRTVYYSSVRTTLFVRPATADETEWMLVGAWHPSMLLALGLLHMDTFQAAISGDRLAGLDAGSMAQDPRKSAPDVVAEVAAAHGLSEDSAALYIQLLALPDPTDRNVQTWNGWTPAQRRKAQAELGELVVEGKRPRAGRSAFLPGGWNAWKAPVLPVETWKSPLLTLEAPIPFLGVPVPKLPVPDLFAAAWKRCLDGDAPRYEEL